MKDPNQIEYIKENGKIGVKTINREPTNTQQQYAAECDINQIMSKYESAERFMRETQLKGAYADFSQITDYQEMQNTIKYADEAFSSLPASMRQKFKNDPNELLMFLQDPKNRAEGEKLGLINPPPPTPPMETLKPNNDSNDDPKLSPTSKSKPKPTPE